MCPLCVYNNSQGVIEYHHEGTVWNDGPCRTVKCEALFNDCLRQYVGQVTVKEETCEECPLGTVRPNSSEVCCPPCERLSPTEPPNRGDHCGLKLHKREQYVVTSDNCTSVHRHNISSCKGNCISSAIATTGNDFYEPDCSCCKPDIYTEKMIKVQCPDGAFKETMFTVIEKCKCDSFKCVAGPSHEQEVAVDVNNNIIDTSDKRRRRRRALSRLFALPP